MSAPTPGSPTPSDDDLDWLRALGGAAPRSGADPATLHEAGLLREASRRWPAGEAGPRPDAGDAMALLQRARREVGPATPAPRRWRWPTLLGPLLGVAVAAALVLVVVPWQPAGEDTVERAGAAVLRTSATPAHDRDLLADALEQAGVAPVRRYQRGARYGLDADLPVPVPPAVAALLQRRAIALPADGALVVAVGTEPRR